MDKDRDVKDGIRGQVMHLNPPNDEGGPERNQKWETEAPKNIRKTNDRFVRSLMRKRLPIGTPPMDHAPRLKKMTLYQIQQMRVGILTRLPPVDLRLAHGSVAHLPLRSRSLRRLKNREARIHSLTSRPGASVG